MEDYMDPNALQHGKAMLDRDDARARIVARYKAQRQPMYATAGSGEVVEPAERAPAQEYAPEPPASASYEQPARGIDRDKLRQLAERIQVGDTDEGADALAELAEHTRGVDREALKRELRQEATLARIRAEQDQALGRFGNRYPNVANDKVLVDAATTVIRDELAADLKRAGASDKDLAAIRGDVGKLAAAHNYARAGGLKLRTPDEILDSTGKTLTDKFNIRPASRDPMDYVRNLRAQRGFNSKRGAHLYE
ncbi:MAG TPA: hypothetical protein VGF29_20625 [Hyphomicrobiaceae bacterium]|jgi:hypothetical protein